MCFGSGGNRVFYGSCGNGFDIDSVLLGQLEEGGRIDAVAVGTEAGVVLFVGLLGRVAGIEAADAVEEIPAGFSKGLANGEADLKPLFVGGGDIDLLLLDTANDGLDVGVGVGAVFGGFAFGLAGPLLGIEFFICHEDELCKWG